MQVLEVANDETCNIMRDVYVTSTFTMAQERRLVQLAQVKHATSCSMRPTLYILQAGISYLYCALQVLSTDAGPAAAPYYAEPSWADQDVPDQQILRV